MATLLYFLTKSKNVNSCYKEQILVWKDDFQDTLSCQHLLAQCHQCKQQSYVWNLFKVNNKYIGKKLKMSFNNFELIDFKHGSGISIVNFELVNNGKVGI